MGQGNKLLHILRNPWGFGDHEVKAARLEAAEKIESLEKELEAVLKDRVALAAGLDAERGKVSLLREALRNLRDAVDTSPWMPKKSAEMVKAAVEDAERLGYFLPPSNDDVEAVVQRVMALVYKALPDWEHANSIEQAIRAELGSQKLPQKELVWLYTHCRAIGMNCHSDSGRFEEDMALFTMQLVDRVKVLEGELGRVPATSPLTENYIQNVPDKCDRIIWRNRFYHLPISVAEVPAVEPVTDEEAMKAVLNFYRTEEGSTSGLLAVDTDCMKLALESFLQSRAAKGVKL